MTQPRDTSASTRAIRGTIWPQARSISAPECTLLVASCDGYADLWEPYLLLLGRFWPDCPFPVALITEERRPKFTGVRALCLGAGLDWSTLMLRALDAVNTPYILLTLEDFFLRKRVDTARVLALFRQVCQQDLHMLRLIPRPGPTGAAGSDYGIISATAPYRVSTQAAFWNVETLRKLLVPGESAWEFEVNGSKRSVGHWTFVGVRRAALPYRHHVVERGKWFPWAAWRFGRLDVGVDTSVRPVMTTAEAARWITGKMAAPFIRRIPARLRRALKPAARRFGFVK